MATEDPESKEDPGVVQIACQVADAKDHEVPGFLIRLKSRFRSDYPIFFI